MIDFIKQLIFEAVRYVLYGSSFVGVSYVLQQLRIL